MKGASPIGTIAEWKELAPPKAEYQWKEARSAFELARAWCSEGIVRVPPEVLAILETTRETRGAVPIRGEPECRLRFDRLRGEPRNADLTIEAVRRGRPIAIAIEAKADEPYGELIGEALAASVERALSRGRSNGMQRIEQLARALLPIHRAALPGLGGLRYQLLTACAGALVLADRMRASYAVLLVHEFFTAKTIDANHARNHDDLEAFVLRLSNGRISTVRPGKPSGRSPFRVCLSSASRRGCLWVR